MDSPALHPEALEDLRRSGIDDATIAAARLYTPPPGDLPRLLSARLVEKVRHVLVFPYDGASHGLPMRRPDEFVRCKLFPSVSDGQGHTIRYYQRAGTPPRLYIPPPARAVLADPAVPLLITEGEKKALKANQEGLACIGIGGLWNWQHAAGRPIADLDRIDWVERETSIVPDSDVWTRPDLVQPVFALGKELEGRGARVTVLKLPATAGGSKAGLDDYLCAHAREAFAALPRLPLKHAAFSRTQVWWRAWVKRKEAGPTESEPSVLELLERGETTRFLHPALDVVDGILFYGIPVGDKLTIVTSRREGFTPATLPSGIALRHADPGPSSMRHETAAAWLGGRAEGSVAQALDGLAGFLTRYVALRDPGAALWLGTWVLGTWCYRAFRVFPYLSVRSAERRCGKSRLMRLLCRVGFNASPPTTHPTEAQLYREAARRSGLQAFDEMESLKGGGDKERLAALISVLNVGFEQGGAVSRQEKRGERFVEVLHEVYAPRIIAGIAGLKDTLEDRSLTLVMFRRRKDEAVARLGRDTDAEAERLREACALACLTRIQDILTAYEIAPTILDTHDVDDRAVDLWTPLLALAMVADAEAAGDRAERIVRAARELSDARDADDEAGQAARLVAALQRVAEDVGRTVTPTELLQALHDRGYAWVKSPRGLAGLVAPLGFVARHARESGRRGRFYTLDPAVLADLATRYDPAAREGMSTLPGISVTSVDKRDNASDDGHLQNFQEVLTG
ncbi:MAG: hypothetical protein C5B48_08470 [Candidatus Rokuibacteriota bacterium]|nr:MAG: hypothetical protein C5B48_08470 [Candidatus Rokubacteria bacterium]